METGGLSMRNSARKLAAASLAAFTTASAPEGLGEAITLTLAENRVRWTRASTKVKENTRETRHARAAMQLAACRTCNLKVVMQNNAARTPDTSRPAPF
eukprot:7238968-Prymnesium_polylepis.1